MLNIEKVIEFIFRLPEISAQVEIFFLNDQYLVRRQRRISILHVVGLLTIKYNFGIKCENFFRLRK